MKKLEKSLCAARGKNSLAAHWIYVVTTNFHELPMTNEYSNLKASSFIGGIQTGIRGIVTKGMVSSPSKNRGEMK